MPQFHTHSLDISIYRGLEPSPDTVSVALSEQKQNNLKNAYIASTGLIIFL